MADVKHPGLLMVQMEVPAEFEDELNAWYWDEHVPERLACPGFISARRFKLEDTNGSVPKYLALYELEDISALQTPEYRHVTGPGTTERTKNVGRNAKITRSEFVELLAPEA